MVIQYIVIIVLVLFSGLFSGLTLGLMSLNAYELKRKAKIGDLAAKKIYPIRKQGNLLLCTLLLGNVLVNSILAVFLGSLTTGVIATIISTGLIVVFGEIIPQSFFSRHALKYGSKFLWLVKIFKFILYPVTKPLAWMLDKTLGGELPTVYSKKELHAFVQEQKNLKQSDIKEHEFQIIERGLSFSDKRVHNVMTPFKNIFVIKYSDVLDRNLLATIHKAGHSRIPVMDSAKRKVVGILYSKDLISITPQDRKKAKELMRKRTLFVRENDKLDVVLKKFKERRVHLFIVKNNRGSVVGLITLEDVLEEIVGEIVDEYDLIVDMRKAGLYGKVRK